MGDAPCLFDDLAAAGQAGEADFMAINRAGYKYTGRIEWWATYHALYYINWRWAEKRAEAGGNTDYTVITHRRYRMLNSMVVPHPATSGSSTLLGVYAGLHLGYSQIVVAGAPLSDPPYEQYRRGWQKMGHLLAKRVISLSGWTKRFLEGLTCAG